MKTLSHVEGGEVELRLEGSAEDSQVTMDVTCGDVGLTLSSLLDVHYCDSRSVRYRKVRSSNAEKVVLSKDPIDAATAQALEKYNIINSQQLSFRMRSTQDIEQLKVEILLVTPKEVVDVTSNACMLLIRGVIKFSDLIENDSPSKVKRIDLLKGSVSIPSLPSPREPDSSTRLRRVFLSILTLALFLWLLVSSSPLYPLIFLIPATYFLLNFDTPNQYFNGNVFFVNGWSVWSFCGVVRQGNSVPPHGLPSVFVRGFHSGSRALDINLRSSSLFAWLGLRPRALRDHIASDMFTTLANTVTRRGITMGFVSQKEQFGYISTDADYRAISVYCDLDGVHVLGGSTIRTDWFAIHLQPSLDEDTQAMYMRLAGHFNGADKLIQKAYTPVGWCSWYHFFEKIDENVLYKNIEDMKEMDRKYKLADTLLFQIDDGYQDSWGDWLSLSKSKFPSQSMPALVRAIKEAGMTPGVWAAPFACDKHSELAKNHPHWVLRRGSTSTPANSGNCGKWFYGLDVTNPEVQNFIRSTIEVIIKEWGFQYLKLDFLYAAALEHSRDTYHNPYLTRAQAVQVGLDVICGLPGIGQTFILGCGAPVGSVIGKVNANRVSADAGLGWLPEAPLPFWDRWNLPCARNMMRNTLCKLGMHNKWWVNDPDCILLRHSTHFSDDEIRGIASVKAMSGGSVIISDHLPAVSPDRMRIVRSILPTISLSAVPLDILEREMPEILKLKLTSGVSEWVLLGLCNWEDNRLKRHKIDLRGIFDSRTLGLISTSTQLILSFDFWKSECFVLSTNQLDSWRIEIPIGIPVHSAVVMSLRPLLDPRIPYYLGSNLHFSCGSEVDAFDFGVIKGISYLTLTLKEAFLKGDDWNGEVFIYLPLLALSFEALASYELFIHGVDESVRLRYSFVDKVESHGCIVKIHLGHDLCSHVAIEPAFKLHVHLSWMK